MIMVVNATCTGILCSGVSSLEILINIITSIIIAILIVPVIMKNEERIDLNLYLRLLTREIRENLQKIDALPDNLLEVRSRKRAWLPGVAAYNPQPGYPNTYLSTTAYNGLRSQKIWLFIEGATTGAGAAGRLNELYELVRRYCDIVHALETHDLAGRPLYRVESPFAPNDQEIYSDRRFAILEPLVKGIRHHSKEFNPDDINTIKEPRWWWRF